METTLVDFVKVLRTAEVKVSPAETLDAMADGGLIKPATAMVTRFALRALSNFTGDKKGDRIRVSLTIQDNYLHVGPIKLIKLPKMIWN